MGIDVYLKWDGMTEEEKSAQYTGFSTVMGHVGYLREAYHGGPYATKVLLPEGWEEKTEGRPFPIQAKVLRERLRATQETAKTRELWIYGEEVNEKSPVIKAFENFVKLAEKKEKEGKKVEVYVDK